MTLTMAGKAVGWAIVAAAAAVWVRLLAAGLNTVCTFDCWRYQLWALAGGTLSLTGVGVAGWILVFAYERDPAASVVSSPVGVLAKVGRVLAYGSFPLAVGSLMLIFLVGPLALLVSLWILAMGQMMSTAAAHLDRLVSPGVLSNVSQWAVAAAVCMVVLGAVYLAAGSALAA